MDKQTEATSNAKGILAEVARPLMAAATDVAVHEHRYSQQEEVVNEITAWWQKALGTKAVLGQASNRPPPGPRPRVPKLLWTKAESGQAEQEKRVVEATPRAAEKKEASNPGTQERRGRFGMDRSLNALRQLKHWSGVMVSGAVLVLAILLLRCAVAVVVAIYAAPGILKGRIQAGQALAARRQFLDADGSRTGEE